MTCPSDDRLQQLAAGEASDDDARLIETHIDQCEECRSVLSAITRGAEPAASFGRYRLDGVLGSGGMGIVYDGYDPQLKRAVAIKVVRRVGDDAGRERLVREAQSLARLSHRHVCQVYDVGTEGEEVWVAMEKIDGVTLREWARPPVRRRELLAVLANVGDGLAAAHAAGLIHRDVKPENVLVTRDGRAVVTDFGLARVDAPAEAPSDGTVSTLAGTPAYLAPEQLARKPIDARVDQFAFAVMAWELLGGARPFAAAATLGRPIANVLRRALAADPADRYPSMTALCAALRRTAHRRTIALAIAALVVVGAGAAWFGIIHSADDPTAVCATGADQIARVWNPTRAASLRTAFVATGASFAADSADRVIALLDAFEARYRRETVDACETTLRRGSASQQALDVRRACLDHGALRADQLLAVFAQPDRAIVGLAITATYAVTELDACHDISLMLVRQDEPADPRVRAQLADLRTQLAHAEALYNLGDSKHALPIAQAVAQAADAIAYFPLRADAAYRIGIIERLLGEPKLADEAMQRAIVAAEAGRDDVLAANAWTRLMTTAGEKGDFAEATHRGEQAKAKLERVGNPPDSLAYWLINHALVARLQGDLTRARADAERGIALYESIDPERPRIASALTTLSEIYGGLGLHELQLHTAQRSAALAEKLRGPDHPITADALDTLGDALSLGGEHTQALAAFERALAIRMRSYGDDSIQVSVSLSEISGELIETGDRAGAEQKITRALEIRTKHLGPDHPTTLGAEANLGTLLSETRPAAALVHLEHVLAVRQAHTPDSASVALVVYHIGQAQHALGDHPAARASLQRALTIFIAKLGATHPRVAMVWSGLGSLELDTKPAAAIEPLEHAVAIDDRGEREPSDVANDRLMLANALWITGGDRARARALVTTAHDGLKDGDAAQRRELETWLAAHRLE